MPYRVLFRGSHVVCDTADEVDNLLSKGAFSREIANDDPSEDAELRQQKARVMASLSRLQRRFLEALANKREISDTEARDTLGLTTNKELAGTLAAIARKFVSANLPNIVQTEKTFKDGSRTYLYWLHSADASLIREVLSEEKQG